MIDYKKRGDEKAQDIWNALNDKEKENAKELYPNKDLNNPLLREYLFERYKNRLVTVIVK